MAGAREVINNDPDVKSIFINIFGGITKGDEVANGIITAMGRVDIGVPIVIRLDGTNADERSEEHTSELQSLMRISYAVFCLKKKNEKKTTEHAILTTTEPKLAQT